MLTQMKRLQRAISIYIGATLIVLHLGACIPKKLTVAAVDQYISGAVPVGTEHSRVAVILDSLRLEHSAFDQKSRTIVARMPDDRKRVIVKRTFLITFVFDAEGKLASHTAKEAFTGP